MILSWVMGDRDGQHAHAIAQDLASRVSDLGQINTDALGAARIDSVTYFEGPDNDRRVSHVTGGMTRDDYTPTSVTVYHYKPDGTLHYVKTYNTEDDHLAYDTPDSVAGLGNSKLVSLTVYFGEKGKEKPLYSFSDSTTHSSMGSVKNKVSKFLALKASRCGEFSTTLRLSPVIT
jgi:hypothetical protein